MEADKAPAKGAAVGEGKDKDKDDKAGGTAATVKEGKTRTSAPRTRANSKSRRGKSKLGAIPRRGSVSARTADLQSEEAKMADLAKTAATKAAAYKAKAPPQQGRQQQQVQQQQQEERKGAQQQKQTTMSDFCTKKTTARGSEAVTASPRQRPASPRSSLTPSRSL